MAGVATPHDTVFKTSLSRVETVRDFIEFHPPPSLVKIYKLKTLRLESDSSVGDDLRPYFSDTLYSSETASGHGYVHVPVGHQSSPDEHTSFRLMCYVIVAIQRHLEAGNDTLSLVILVLLHHDKQNPWQGSAS